MMAPETTPKAKSSTANAELFHVITTALIVLVLGLVNYLAFRHYERFDWTSAGMYTLSDKSKSVLKGLKEDVTVYLFMSRNEPSFTDTDELLQRYKTASRHVVVQYVDPDREPGEFQILSQRFGVQQGVNELGETRVDVAAVVAMGDKKWHVDRDDLVGFDLGPIPGIDSIEVNIKAEQAMTGAIVQVLSGRATKVCVTRGHGEISLDDQDERSLISVKTALRHDNVELEPLETMGKTAVPKECDAVLVLGPQNAFAESEAKVIVEYVKGGGRALLALDPVIENDVVQPTGFEGPLETLGVRLDRSLALELNEEHLLSPSPLLFLVTEFGEHRSTRMLRGGARVVLTLARSLSVLAESDKIEVLLRASPQSFAVTDVARIKDGGAAPAQAPGDIPGPVDLALAVHTGGEEETKKDGRLIVIGDSDFLQAQFIDAPELENFHLMSAFIGHLTERDALIEIAPKKVKGGNIVFTQDDMTALLFRVGVLIPGAALLLGLAVWLQRRS
jgi:ABC-2 type transport system permease protein